MGKSPCCDEKARLKKGPWTPEEDKKLLDFIQQHGRESWRALPAKAGLERCGKSCRLRWINYLRPDIKRGKFSLQEDQSIIQLHALLGNRWSIIANHLPQRTDNEIKNYWNSCLKKRLIKMGVDPVTHKPKAHYGVGDHSANLSHMAQWEISRLEAEARLARESKSNPPPAAPPHQVQQQLGSSLAHDDHNQLITDKPAMMAPRASRPPCLDILKAWQHIVSKTLTDTVAITTNSNAVNNIQLESPTSTLSFFENPLVIPTVGLNDNILAAADNCSIPSCGGSNTDIKDGTTDENYLRCSEKSNQMLQENWKVDDNSMALLQETTSYVNDTTWFKVDFFQTGNDNQREGLSEIFDF